MEAKKTEQWPVSVNLGARRPWEVYAPDEATALELIRRINTPSGERLPDGVYRHADSLWLSGGFGVPDGWERIHDEAYRWPHPNASRVRPCSSPKVERIAATDALLHHRDAVHVDASVGSFRVESIQALDGALYVEGNGYCQTVDDSGCVSVLAEDQP